MTAATQKGGTFRFLALHHGQWSKPRGFDDLQIGERTPERTRTMNRRCQMHVRPVVGAPNGGGAHGRGVWRLKACN
ncbi:hypothetical protein CXB51_000343 [Gossypium anomalum]|uniref:Uncharacterized protein n=1 Tax=Gossypium anomalum TaxID=47600 RepID=A0A8J5ZIS3_9ROSI|nr:hypothetical protein CXB51_000343 [Gossypium anomalum]